MCVWALVDGHPFQIRSGPRGWKLYRQRVIQACFFLDLLCSDLMLPVASLDLLLPEDPRIMGSLSHCKISEQRLKSRDWPSQSSTWCLFVNLIMKLQEVGWNRSHHAVLLDHVNDTYLQNQPRPFYVEFTLWNYLKQERPVISGHDVILRWDVAGVSLLPVSVAGRVLHVRGGHLHPEAAGGLLHDGCLRPNPAHRGSVLAVLLDQPRRQCCQSAPG